MTVPRITLSVRTFLGVLCLLVAAAAAEPTDSAAPDPQDAPDTVSAINIVGNARTRAEVILLFLELDTGSMADSAAIAAAETRLRATRVFSKVKILTVRKPEGVHLYVVVTELPMVNLSDIGGILYSRRYGEQDSFWRLWAINAAFKLSNFRGNLESLTLSFRFWEWRSVALGWTKPILGTPYSLSTGLGYSSAPYTSRPWRSLTLHGKLSGSRTLGSSSRVYVGATPLYNRKVYYGPADSGSYRVARVFDTTHTVSGTLHPDDARTPDSAWTDTLRVSSNTLEYRAWDGNRLWERDQSDRRFFEVFAGIGAVVKRTDAEYPHRSGWYGWWQIGANIPTEAGDAARAFAQLSSDMHVYHPGSRKRGSVAYRAQIALRNTGGGKFHYLTAGSETTIRGFGSGTLGLASRANNRVLLTAEYRLATVKTPPLRLPALVKIVMPSQDIYYRIDLAAFADYAHLWHDLPHTLTEYESAFSAGAGLRVILQPGNRAICYDVIPVVVYNGTMISSLTDTRRWGWHLYVDLAF